MIGQLELLHGSFDGRGSRGASTLTLPTPRSAVSTFASTAYVRRQRQPTMHAPCFPKSREITSGQKRKTKSNKKSFVAPLSSSTSPANSTQDLSSLSHNTLAEAPPSSPRDTDPYGLPIQRRESSEPHGRRGTLRRPRIGRDKSGRKSRSSSPPALQGRGGRGARTPGLVAGCIYMWGGGERGEAGGDQNQPT